MGELDQQLPQLETLSPMVQSVILNLQKQLGLVYPSGKLRTSQETNNHSFFELAIKLVLALSTYRGNLDEQTSCLIKTWLGLAKDEMPSLVETHSMLNHPGILREIYSQGLADHFPPVFTLAYSRLKRKLIRAETNYTMVNMKGEELGYVCIRTPCIYGACISTLFRFDLASVTTEYTIEVMLDQANISLDENLSALYKHHFERCLHATSRPISFFIYNTRGAASLSFLAHFRNIMSYFKPDIIVLTETRSSSEIPAIASAAAHCKTLYSLHPICFVGGLLILYNNVVLDAEIISREQGSFSARLSFQTVSN